MYNGLYFLWQWQSLFSWVSKSLLIVTAAMKLKDASPWKKSYDKPRQRNEKKRCYFAGKGLYSQSDGFSSSHVYMWELDHKEGWALKNWCFSTAVSGFPCGSAGKESACNAGDLSLIRGLGRSPGEGKGYPLQFSGLGIPGLYSPWGCKKLDTTERLSLSHASPLDCRSMNESILKEINLKYSLKGLMMKLKLQHFGHLMWRSDSLEKILMLGKTGGRGRRGWQGQDGWMASLTQWTWVWASSRRWWKTGKPGMLQYMGSQRVRHNWMTEQQTNGLLFNHKRNEVLIHTLQCRWTLKTLLSEVNQTQKGKYCIIPLT